MAANTWTTLFGASLLKHDGEPVDPSHLSSKTGVLIYFSAHWCPPCRGFTPQLVTYYKEHKDKKNLEIVFVSSDKDDHSFTEYWNEMPWLALPFSDRAKKNELSSKFKVSGIPTLVVLDSNGATITTGGRSKVTSDPEGFPWIPKTFSQIIAGDLIDGKGSHVHFDTLKSKTAIGIYFSAHWCPPCRDFTPKLVTTYNKLKAEGKHFEIIFATSDRDEASFKEYFHEMPWLALPFQDKRISELSELYEVEGIPTLVILNPETGKTINDSGRAAVGADPQGDEFPWHPKPLNSIEAASGKLNDAACLMYIDSNLSDETKEILNSVATHYVKKWETEGKEHALYFFFGKDGDMAKRVLEFTKLNSEGPKLLILNIPDQAKHLHHLPGAVSEQDFRSFVESFLAGTSEKKGIQE